MITIAELFPLHSTAVKWFSAFRSIDPLETVRLEKEYTIHTVFSATKSFCKKEKWEIDNVVCKMLHYSWDDKYITTLWYKNGLLHRTDGYAVETCNLQGYIIHGERWIDGQTNY